jgi:cellulose biosynthesis protein BcsQ
VLLIDLDPQASATKVLGVEIQQRCTIADRTSGTRPLFAERCDHAGRVGV